MGRGALPAQQDTQGSVSHSHRQILSFNVTSSQWWSVTKYIYYIYFTLFRFMRPLLYTWRQILYFLLDHTYLTTLVSLGIACCSGVEDADFSIHLFYLPSQKKTPLLLTIRLGQVNNKSVWFSFTFTKAHSLPENYCWCLGTCHIRHFSLMYGWLSPLPKQYFNTTSLLSLK